jgi:hypothetical protein
MHRGECELEQSRGLGLGLAPAGSITSWLQLPNP